MTDWCVGDLAVCVDATPCQCGFHNDHLQLNAVYRVTEVLNLYGRTGLLLADIDPGAGHPAFGATRFRKIRPDTHEACEAEFVTLLKRSKRRVEA